ncbi:10042_t:CDS:2 [Scutellospora calospora]|uniref:10042_t:CDS:1 n=1 Tax=Scutellospora calospora TaxID=85575 RepID=A0ACA9L5D5_9GLOM|nr:10042_t:CDS:2 [Scutellospora calospora]
MWNYVLKTPKESETDKDEVIEAVQELLDNNNDEKESDNLINKFSKNEIIKLETDDKLFEETNSGYTTNESYNKPTKDKKININNTGSIKVLWKEGNQIIERILDSEKVQKRSIALIETIFIFITFGNFINIILLEIDI